MSLTVSGAQAQNSEAGSVTLFSGESFSGTAESWHLPPGRPYLSVPFIGEALNQKVASARLGADVALVLFNRPHFATKDNGCGPSLGGFQDKSLWWRGRTATHLPDRPSLNNGPLNLTKMENGAFASMILYRRDIGPPPGALLLDRRAAYNRGCDSMLHTSNYNRLFTPVPDGPDRAACFNVSAPASSPGAGEKPPKFRRSAELALLSPARLDSAYSGLVHRTRVQLFDQADCQGNSVSFPRLRGTKQRFMLSDYEFRNKTRSILVTYDSGPAEAAYQAPAASPAAAPAVAQAEAEVSTPQPLVPSVSPSPVPTPELSAATDAAALKAPKLEITEPQVVIAVPEPTSPEPEVLFAVPAPPAQPETSAATPQATASVGSTGQPAKYSLQPPAPAPLPASQLGPKVQDLAAPAVVQPQTQQTGTTQQAAAAPLVVLPAIPENVTEGVSQPVTAVQLPSEAQAAITGSPTPSNGEVFRYPVHKDYRLNFCYSGRDDCGAPAAQAWCKAQGFSRALSWKKDANVGALFPTIVLGTEKLCDKYLCDGFEEISCGS